MAFFSLDTGPVYCVLKKVAWSFSNVIQKLSMMTCILSNNPLYFAFVAAMSNR